MSETKPHRRDFVRTLALGTSTGLVVGTGAALAPIEDPTRPVDDRGPQPSVQHDSAPPRADPPAPEPPDPIEAEVDARMNLILARYGDRLDDDAREDIRREVAGIVRRARSLRAYPLDNGDGPATVWTPYRAPLGT